MMNTASQITENAITRVVRTITRVQEDSVEVKTSVPAHLINDPLVIEYLEHCNHEVQDTANAIKLIHDSTTATASALMDNINNGALDNIHTKNQTTEEQPESNTDIQAAVVPSEFIAHKPPEVRPVHLIHSSAVDAEGHNVSRKNRDIQGRKLIIITSKMHNLAHVTTHIGYTSRTKDQAIKFARNDLSKQGVTLQLSKAQDLEIHIENNVYDAKEVRVQKRNKMLELVKDGWVVLGLLPKV